MKRPTTHTPPTLAQRLLGWYCKPELLEDLQGDLNEYFERNIQTKGIVRARLFYWLDVLKFFRLYTLRKPKFLELVVQWVMINSYIKTSGRNIVRNKLFSFINIFGLAISMSVGLLMIAFIQDITSYDDFNARKDRVYRVISTEVTPDRPSYDCATTSVLAGKKIQESVSGIETVCLMRRGFEGGARVGNYQLPVTGLWADESFFSIFGFTLIQGDPATALKAPHSIVLTEQCALKLFASANVLGNSLKIDSSEYLITGVMEDVPHLSHMRFEALASFSTVEVSPTSKESDYMSWRNFFSNYTYVLLPRNGDAHAVQSSLDKLAADENRYLERKEVRLSLQPMSEIPLHAKMGNPIGPAINEIGLWVLGGLALVVIVSACFNYTNLSIARSLKRSREVGIRKVIGASRSNVLGQFIAEAVIISLLALLFSFLIFLFLRDQFLELAPLLSDLLSLRLSFSLIGWFVLLAVTIGIVAGFLPALFFSKVNATKVLKGVGAIQVFRRVSLRKALIVVQYTFSLVFITVTIVGFNQYRSFLVFDLGFSTENILNIHLQGNESDPMVQALREVPGVAGISQSTIVPSLGSIYGMQIKYHEGRDSSNVWLNFVDSAYLPLHQHKLVAGTNFKSLSSTYESEVLVNEKLLSQFDIAEGDPQKAVGETLLAAGRRLTIVGVLQDFHYGTLEDRIEPLIFRHSGHPGGYLNVLVNSPDLPATMVQIESAWKKIDPVHPYGGIFYGDQIERAYSQFSVMIKVIGFLSFLAICISSMGLFGMVVFTTETKLKEISIRKVMGASEGLLILLLSRGFFVLLVISSAIALPATYLLFDRVVLEQFAFHQPLTLMEFVPGPLVVLAVAVAMIVSQTLNVARANPAEVLKNE